MPKHNRRTKEPVPYAPPVDQLLTLGHPRGPECDSGWYNAPFADYAAMGLTREHVPELVRLMRDPMRFDSWEDGGVFACVHAARALGAVGGMAAWGPLIDLLRRLVRLEWDYWLDDMESVLAAIGPEAIDAAKRLARDHRELFSTRIALLGALRMIAERHTETRSRVLEFYAEILENGLYETDGVNEYAVDMLVHLLGAEQLPAIERAYERGYINEGMCGPLEDVRKEIQMTPEERRVYVDERVRDAVERLSSEATGDLLLSAKESLEESA